MMYLKNKLDHSSCKSKSYFSEAPLSSRKISPFVKNVFNIEAREKEEELNPGLKKADGFLCLLLHDYI